MTTNEPLADGFVVARRKAAPKTDRGQLVAPCECAPRHQSRQQIERWCNGRARQARRATLVVDHVDPEPILQLNTIACANPIEKGERVAIAAEQHVLAVVDALSSGGIGKCRGAAPDGRPRLE